MTEKVAQNNAFETKYYKPIKNRWPIVLWLFLSTLALLVFTKGLSLLEIAQSILLTFVVSFFLFFDIYYFNKKNLNLLPEIIKISSIAMLVMMFGYWGMIYTVFFLIILIIDAFSYSLRDFVIVILMIAAALWVVWMFGSDPVLNNPLIRNTFFLVVSNAIFALGILLRMFARESLYMKQREKDLEREQDLLQKENEEIAAILNNMESAIFSLSKNNDIYFANKSAVTSFPEIKKGNKLKSDPSKILLSDTLGKSVSLKGLVDSPDGKLYRNDLVVSVNGKTVNYNSLVTKIYDEKGEYSGAMISLHSLTADEMLEKSRMEFASLASHEIRTPLTVIEGYSYLMLNSKEFEYNQITRDYLTMLHDTTTDLIRLSNGILSMSKIDEGSVRVNVENVDLGSIIKDVVAEELKAAKSKGLNIEYNISRVPRIDSDKTKIGEILRNLVENAIKFSDKGIISIDMDQNGDEIDISVEDSGIGIPEGSKEKIFTKFYQVENWDTRKNSGSGLGLYVSKAMSRRIGGDLVLEETSRKGSKFTLILPVRYPNADDLKKRRDKKLKEFIEGF